MRPLEMHPIIHATLSAFLALTLLGTAILSDKDAARAEFSGACYCRAAGQLSCLGVMTKRECDQRCMEAFCDEWFWLERRACWNWGYGG